MKRHSKILGIAAGERSMLIADVVGGDAPQVRKLAEFVYPEGVTPTDAPKLGAELASFLKSNNLTTRTAVIGLPARWLVVKTKEVPPTDPATLADLLRLQAESDFSSELKDLVYDYAGTSPVMLVATPKKHVDGLTAVCEAAGVGVAGVISSAMALAEVSNGDLVLAVSAAGAELTAAHGTAIRHLRAPSSERAFAGELRRAVSTIPANGGGRELVLWDGLGLDAKVLTGELGFPVKAGSLATLGLAAPARNDARFAPAVAVALAGMSDHPLPVDFAHSKLAPVHRRAYPRWAWMAVAAVIVLVTAGVYAYRDLARQEADVAARREKLKRDEDTIKSAEKFVSRVKFAQAYHYNDPRYVACLRDLTERIPNDEATFATKISLREAKPEKDKPGIRPGDLSGEFFGKTTESQYVDAFIATLRKTPGFESAEWGASQTNTRGGVREVSFSIKFLYRVKPAAGGK